MNLSASEIAYIAGGFTILGTLLGTFITYRFALRLSNLSAQRLAKIKLREAFIPTLSQIRHPDKNSLPIDEILEADFIKHQTAVDEYRFFLSGVNLHAFTKAWEEYYADQKTKKKSLSQYSEFLDVDNIYPKPAREMAIDRIEAILEFTKN